MPTLKLPTVTCLSLFILLIAQIIQPSFLHIFFSLSMLVYGPLPHPLEPSPSSLNAAHLHVSSSLFLCLLQNLDDLQVFSAVYTLSEGHYFKTILITDNLLVSSQ